MVQRLPLVVVAGQIQQLQNGDTLSANASGALAQASNLSDVASLGLAVANLEQPTAAPSASASLLRAAAEQDQYATGTITLTMPNGGAGWRSGIITNDNPLAGLITLAVPSGATLDGATDGTTVLYPVQRARIRQTGASAYRTVWIDRSPLVALANVASGVSAIDLPLPAGYARFRVTLSGILVGTSGAEVGYRLSDGGSGSIKSGSGDYQSQRLIAAYSNSGPAQNLTTTSYGSLAVNLTNGTQYRALVQALLNPGGSGQAPGMISKAVMQDTTPQIVTYDIGSLYTGGTSGAMGRANLLRLVASTGLLALNATAYGEP